jgi:probable rRNA maturation factor
MKVIINAADKKYSYSNKLIVDIVNKLSLRFGVCDHYEIAVNFSSAAAVRKLNGEYRSINKATDVLSFPLEEAGGVKKRDFKPRMPLLLGDIFLCPDYILKNNVIKGGSSFCYETAYLLIHGFMHLIGYHHPHDGYSGSKMRKDAEKFIESQIRPMNISSLIKVKRR